MRPDLIVLEVNLRAFVRVLQDLVEALPFVVYALRVMGFAFVIEECDDAIPVDVAFERLFAEEVAKLRGMIVVSVETGNGTGDSVEDLLDESHLFKPARPEVGVVQPVERVVDQIPRYREQIGCQPVDLIRRFSQEIGHQTAAALAVQRVTWQVVSQMKVGNVGDTHCESP